MVVKTQSIIGYIYLNCYQPFLGQVGSLPRSERGCLTNCKNGCCSSKTWAQIGFGNTHKICGTGPGATSYTGGFLYSFVSASFCTKGVAIRFVVVEKFGCNFRIVLGFFSHGWDGICQSSCQKYSCQTWVLRGCCYVLMHDVLHIWITKEYSIRRCWIWADCVESECNGMVIRWERAWAIVKPRAWTCFKFRRKCIIIMHELDIKVI